MVEMKADRLVVWTVVMSADVKVEKMVVRSELKWAGKQAAPWAAQWVLKMVVLRAVQRAEVWAEKKVQSMAVRMGTLKVAQTVLSRAEQRVVPWVALMENERDSQLAAMLAV